MNPTVPEILEPRQAVPLVVTYSRDNYVMIEKCLNSKPAILIRTPSTISPLMLCSPSIHQ
jgi:hypothetical protein